MKKEIQVKKQFFQSLKCGTGRAYLIQKENPDIDFSEEIFKGAVRNYVYDAQCEGSRADYIYQLIKQSKKADSIEKKVLQRLLKEKKDWYGLDQMCDLAVLFYKAGNVEAREILETRFMMNSLEGNEFCGQDQIIEIDGIKGILKVAKLIGKHLYRDENDYETSWRVDRFQEENKHLDVYKILKKKSKKNKYIKKYLNSILENKSKPYKRRKAGKISCEVLKKGIEEKRFMGISKKQAAQLKDKEVKKLANDFLAEKNEVIKEKYLRFFARRKYPKDISPLMQIVAKKKPKKTNLVMYAAKSLQFFTSKEIRKLALNKIKKHKNPSDYLPLLVANYRKGDAGLLLKVLERSKHQEFIHSMVFGLIEIYKVNKVAECREPLEKIYNTMTCGIHRMDIIDILYENNVLRKSILRELEFDSYSSNRDLFKKFKKNSRI